MASNVSSSSTLPLPKYLKEDNISQECRDLLPTLPSEKGWVSSHLHLFRRFWFSAPHLNGVLSCRKNFLARDDDVLLATSPKSGTTWLKALLFALSRRYMGGDNLEQPNPLLTTNPHELVPFLELTLFVDNENPDLSHFSSPRIFSTHIPYPLLPDSIRDSKCKIVYMCRNMKDTFSSLWHFASKLRPKEKRDTLEEIFDRFCRGVSLFGPCWDHASGYWKASLENPEKVLFLRYEDMKERPVEALKEVAKFIGFPFQDDEDEAVEEILRMCSFESLSHLEVNKNGKLNSGEENNSFFRKGEVGDWMNLLSPEMAERLDRITAEKLSGSGLTL